MLDKIKLTLQKSEPGEWYDHSLKRLLKGTVYAYTFEWKELSCVLNVRISEDKSRAQVNLVSSSKADIISKQLTEKTLLFQKSKIPNYLYIPLSIAYVDKFGRIHYNRVSNVNDVPEVLRDNFELRKYDDVAPPELIRSRNPNLGKISVIVEDNNPEKMALLYAFTRILPAYSRN